MPSSSNGAMNGAGPGSSSSPTAKQPLYVQYPVGSSWEFSMSAAAEEDEKVQGTVYCTDEVSQTVVIQKPLAHTTLATEIRILNANSIVQATKTADGEEASEEGGPSSLFQPLPKIQKKVLEERERRAIRLAEDSFRHINQKASPEGQAVFDRLLKACNEVVWKGESILVLNQIQVDPPYGPGDCRMMSANGKQGVLEDSSLERVKKIVATSNSAG